MDAKMALYILFGAPTILLAYIYLSFGINNYWQLFLFSFMVVIGYMPGAIVWYMLQTNWIRNIAQRSLSDFDNGDK